MRRSLDSGSGFAQLPFLAVIIIIVVVVVIVAARLNTKKSPFVTFWN